MALLADIASRIEMEEEEPQAVPSTLHALLRLALEDMESLDRREYTLAARWCLEVAASYLENEDEGQELEQMAVRVHEMWLKGNEWPSTLPYPGRKIDDTEEEDEE